MLERADMRLDDLRELARLCSIQLSYEDAAGKTRTASREALETVLAARFPQHATLEEALRARREEIARRVVEPVTVAWGSEVPLLELRVPLALQDERATCEITLESGDHVGGIVHLGALRAEGLEAGSVGKTAMLPSLPAGYHALRLTLGGSTYESAIFVAPQRAHAPEARSWGIFAPVYAMRTDQTRGIGDLGDMQAYRAWINELGGGIVATLPMNAMFPDDDPSPYSPVSRLYWNELYLDVRALPEWQGEELPPHEGLQIDWKRVATERHAVMSKLAERFVPDEEYERFAATAHDYAAFMGGPSPGASRHPLPATRGEGSSGLLPATRGEGGRRPDEGIRYHLYVQYRMAQQMRALAADARRGGLGLYLDFPLGVSPHGYDAHRYAEHFAKGVSVGAPPDLFFTKGQNWGFPPFDPDAIRERHHSYFRDCIRHQLAHAGVLRIDHVMGLHRLFWIPSGGEAKDGLYVRYPDEEFYAILTIESSRSRSAIVGEDLGTVPQYVPRMMSRHGIRRMYVLQYEIKDEGEEPAGKPAAESIASINTHDMPTFAAFWDGDDVDDRLRQGLLDETGAAEERAKRAKMRAALTTFLTARGLLSEEASRRGAVLEAVLRFLASSDAEMVLVNLEDLWLEREPVNRPGVAGQSWRRRMRVTLDEARASGEVGRLLGAVNDRRRMGDGDQK